MAYNYPRIAGRADKMLAKFGGPVTIVRPGETTYVPGEGTAQGKDKEFDCTGCVFEFDLNRAGTMFAAGTMIEAGDKHLILSPAGVPATFGPPDRVQAFGVDLAVIAVKTTAPAGIPVLYEALLRK